MAKNNVFRFYYGDTVRVKTEAPPLFRPGEVASICGMRSVDEGMRYTIEYTDGSSVEIQEHHLTLHSREFRALILKSGQTERRVSVHAASIEDAQNLLEQEHGKGTVFDLHNDDDANENR